MGIKVKAVERQLKVGKDAGKYRFMMQAEIYNTLSAQKVIHEAAVRSGISEGALSAAWDAIGQVVRCGPPKVTLSPSPDWDVCDSV